MRITRTRIALATICAALALTAGTCNPEAIGAAGTVTAKQNSRWDCTGGRCKGRLWLTTRNTQGASSRFEVSKPTYMHCQIGDAYPTCKP